MDIHAYIQSGIIESYLLGIAGEEEKQELDQMRRMYPEIENAIHDAEEWLHGVASPSVTPVPSKVKEKIFATISKESKPTPAVEIRIGNPVYKYIAAAATVLLISSVAANLVLYNKYNAAKENLLALQDRQQLLLTNNNAIQAKMNIINNDIKMITATGASKIVMKAVDGKGNIQSTLMMDETGNHLLLMSNSLPIAPAGKQYQLWAIVDGKPVNAGLLSNCEPYCKFSSIAHAQAYAVTLEQEGGSNNPTLDQMYVFGKVNS